MAAAQIDADLARIHGLADAGTPSDDDVVDAARLVSRYSANPEALRPLAAVVRSRGMDRAALNAKARALWQGGYRPTLGGEVSAGSGSDVVDPQGVPLVTPWPHRVA
jgi:hypothetical protein